MFETAKLLAGLLLAIFGADKLVDGGVAIANRYSISEVIIGALIIGFGTSMPEFTVNVLSSIHRQPDLAVTNILGSNIFNILMILGVAALIRPLTIQDELRKREIPYSLMAILLVGVCGNEILIDRFNFSALIPSDGIVFLFFFIIFLSFSIGGSRSGNAKPIASAAGVETGEQVLPGTGKSILLIIFGLVALVGGGELIVQGAKEMAARFGLSQKLIGLLIVGPGTSFPELIATVVATSKKRVAMAVGNITGSNIFNVFCVLGVSAVICPLPMELSLNISVLVGVVATAALWLYAYSGDRRIGRYKGMSFLAAYAVYVGYLIHSV
jgi:cation:H+ antiporter